MGCGLWRDMVNGNGRKLGEHWEENWDENGRKYPFFTVPFSPFFQRSQVFHTVPFVKTSSPHSPAENWGVLPLTAAAASADA